MRVGKESSKFRDKDDLELCVEFQKTADTAIFDIMLNRYTPCLKSQAHEAQRRTRDFGLLMEFEDFFQDFTLDLHQAMLKVNPSRIKCNPKQFKFAVQLKIRCRYRVRNMIRTELGRNQKCDITYVDPTELVLSEETESCYLGSYCLLTDGESKFYIPSVDIRNSVYEFSKDQHEFVHHRLGRRRSIKGMKPFLPNAEAIQKSIKERFIALAL